MNVTFVPFTMSNELKWRWRSASVVYESTVAKLSATESRKSNNVVLSLPAVDADCVIAIIGTFEFDSYLVEFL